MPVRLKLQAAALAAEEGDWKRATKLVDEATRDLEKFETLAQDSPMAGEIQMLVADIERMNQQFAQGNRPEPNEIRELAQRTRLDRMQDRQDRQN